MPGFAAEGLGVLSPKWPPELLRDSQRGDPDIFVTRSWKWFGHSGEKYKFKGDLCLGDGDKSKDAEGSYPQVEKDSD